MCAVNRVTDRSVCPRDNDCIITVTYHYYVIVICAAVICATVMCYGQVSAAHSLVYKVYISTYM